MDWFFNGSNYDNSCGGEDFFTCIHWCAYKVWFKLRSVKNA